jgi:hypothetical protein
MSQWWDDHTEGRRIPIDIRFSDPSDDVVFRNMVARNKKSQGNIANDTSQKDGRLRTCFLLFRYMDARSQYRFDFFSLP